MDLRHLHTYAEKLLCKLESMCTGSGLDIVQQNTIFCTQKPHGKHLTRA